MRKIRVKALRKQVGYAHGDDIQMVIQQPREGVFRWIGKKIEWRMFKAAKRLYSRGWMVEE